MPQRSASLKDAAPTGMSMNSWKSMELLAWAPPFSTLSIGTGSAWALAPPMERYSGISRSSATALALASETAKHRVGAEPALVRRAVEVDHGVVDRPLVERVEPADGIGDLTVDVGHRLQHTLAREAAAAVAQLDRLADAGRGAGGSDGAAPRTGVEEHLGFDGRVAAGVEDLAPDHVLNGAHDISPWVSPLVGHRGTTLAVAHPVFGDALGGRGCRRATSSARSRSACSASTPSRWARLATAKSSSPNAACDVGRRHRASGSSGRGSASSARRVSAASVRAVVPGARRRPAPGRPARALRASLVASISAGRSAGMPSVTLRAALLALLDRLPVGDDLLPRSSTSTSPNTWGWRCTSLSCTPARHVGQIEPPCLVRQAGVEDDLEEQVAQLLFAGARTRRHRPPRPVCGPAAPARRAPRSSPRPGGA